MTAHPSHDLARWLDAATSGLSHEQAAPIRTELTAHYEDAVEDYVAQGMAENEAQQRALADLGTPESVAHGFNNVHRGRQHYFAATLVSIVALCAMFGTSQLIHSLHLEESSTLSRVLFALDNLSLLAMTSYVVLVTKWLLNWQFHTQQTDRPITLMLWGLVGASGGDAVFRLIISPWDSGPTLFDVDTLPEKFFALVVSAGLATTGVGLIWLGRSLLRLEDNLYGLGKPLVATAILLGLALVSVEITLHLGEENIRMLGSLTVLLCHLVLWPLLSLLFFRAAFRSPIVPMRLA